MNRDMDFPPPLQANNNNSFEGCNAMTRAPLAPLSDAHRKAMEKGSIISIKSSLFLCQLTLHYYRKTLRHIIVYPSNPRIHCQCYKHSFCFQFTQISKISLHFYLRYWNFIWRISWKSEHHWTAECCALWHILRSLYSALHTYHFDFSGGKNPLLLIF